MEKGNLIGKGMTAEVYEWGHDKVLKLFFERFDEDWAKREAGNGAIVHNAGINSPEVFDTIDIDGRKGIIMERICGKSLSRHTQAEPWKLYLYAQQLARFHYKVHQHVTDGLQSQKDRFTYAINRSTRIDSDKKKRIFDYIEGLPKGTSVCHGDLHFNNIIVSNNKLVALDWSSAYQGNPLGDVARTCLMISSPGSPTRIPDVVVNIFQYTKWMTCWTYLSEYMKLSKVKYEDIDAWILPVAAAKLKDKVNGEGKWLLDIINKRLERYSRYDKCS